MVTFNYTIAYVNNVEAALTFYEQAFGFKRRFLHEENDYGELDTGSTVLAFAKHTLGENNLSRGYIAADKSPQPLGLEIGFITEHVNAIHQKAISLNAEEIEPPQKKTWGQTVSYLRCPFGLLIALGTPMH